MKRPVLTSTLITMGLSLTLGSIPLAPAQDDEGAPNRRVWEAILPGGNYLVRLDRIASVSVHEYVVDGVAIVHEVNIGTDTAGMARFYSLVPVVEGSPVGAVGSVLDRVKQAGSTASARITGQGESIAEKVQKNYPTTTHARTVEFRIPTPEDLEALFSSLKGAFLSGRGDRIQIAPAE